MHSGMCFEYRGDELVLYPQRERGTNDTNTVKTIQATIRNVEENLSIDDLILLVDSLI